MKDKIYWILILIGITNFIGVWIFILINPLNLTGKEQANLGNNFLFAIYAGLYTNLAFVISVIGAMYLLFVPRLSLKVKQNG